MMSFQATAPVLGFAEALTHLETAARALAPVSGTEQAPLLAARGRVLAEPVQADRDQPPFPRSTRDGYAVRAAELSSGAALRVMGSLRAGAVWTEPVEPGCCIGIMTGAPVPSWADCVAMLEHVGNDADAIYAPGGRRWQPGENIVPQGSEAHAGATVLSAGTVLGAAEIALAAACGRAELPVRRRVRVAIVATGDELVEVSETPAPQQIRNSNSYAIAAMVEATGHEAVRLPVTPDRPEAVRHSLLEARSCDLLVLSGGVSMGEYDLVEAGLLEAGATFTWSGVRLQPGRPVVFGSLPARDGLPAQPFFGLPGNPISTQVCFHAFAEPLLRVLGGAPWTGPRWALARLAAPAEGKPGLTRLLPARMEGVEVRVEGWQGSGDLAANARANCYAEMSEGAGPLSEGTIVRVLLR